MRLQRVIFTIKRTKQTQIKQRLPSAITTTDQDGLPLQEANVNAVNLDVHLIKERHPPVAPTSDVLSLHHQGRQGALLGVVSGQDVGVWTLEVMGETIKRSVVRVPRDAALVEL